MRFVALLAIPLALMVAPLSAIGQSTINPDSLGAVGDGSTWDHDALQAAADAAGAGGTVELTHGKTYVICRQLYIESRSLIGNGATLKRCDSIASPLTAGVAAGATVVTVEHPERFELGQAISVVSDPTRAGGEATTVPRILNIAGSDLTLSQALSQAYPIGSSVVVIDEVILIGGSGTTVSGVVLDGNRRSNDEWIAWERGSTIVVTGADIEISNNYFYDCWSNCLKSYATSGFVVTDNVFDSVAAAVLHMSTTDSLRFKHNSIVNSNTTAGAGHSEAAITWSAKNRDQLVAHNCMSDIALGAAFGTINRRTNRNLSIVDNDVCRAEGFFTSKFAAEPIPEAVNNDSISVRRNLAVDVGQSLISTFGGDWTFDDLYFNDNTIVNGYLDFGGLDSSSVSRNTIIMLDHATFGDTSGAFSERAGLVSLQKATHTLVEGNLLVGGEKGMYFQNASEIVADSLIVRSNVVRDFTRTGIATAKTNWFLKDDFRSDNSGILLDANTVSSSLLTQPGDAGVRGGRGLTVLNSCVETNQVAVEANGTSEALATGSTTTQYSDNTFRGSAAAASFLSANNVADILFDSNTVSTAFPPEFGAATGTVLQGNDIDGAASCTLPALPATPNCPVCSTAAPALDGVFINVKVFLEAAYDGSQSMSSAPLFEEVLQDTAWMHPYGDDEFVGSAAYHQGVEFLTPSFEPEVIDWVVVSLRSGPTANTEAGRVAGLLYSDGTVRSLDGSLSVFVPGLEKTSYYVVVHHRNHLAVMSASPVGFATGMGSWDFTTSQAQAFSGNKAGQKNLGDAFGLFGGDANHDGAITIDDFAAWLPAAKLALDGYLSEDFTLDGTVTISDFAIFLANAKSAAETQVPD